MTTSILAGRLSAIKPSPSMQAKARVTELQAQGRDIVDFTLGEPDLGTPHHIIKAANAAMARGETRYTGSRGTPELCRAIQYKFRTENDLSYSLDEIVVANGAKQIIFTALTATIEDGDEVVIPAPYWVSYPDMVRLHGGVPVIVPCGEETGFKLTPAMLERAITKRTKWLILNSPNNPTGAVYSAEELAALADLLRCYPQVWVMTDEIYEHFVYDGMTAHSFLKVAPLLRDRTLTINGLSKAYAMTGWRIGYAGGPAGLIGAIVTLLSQNTSCPNSIAQAAAVEALSGDQSFLRESAALYAGRRNRIVGALNAIYGMNCGMPMGAFYAYPSVAGIIGRCTPEGKLLATDLDVVLYFLDHADVAVLDGGAYGLSPYVRFSFATSNERIDAGCKRIQQAVERLR